MRKYIDIINEMQGMGRVVWSNADVAWFISDPRAGRLTCWTFYEATGKRPHDLFPKLAPSWVDTGDIDEGMLFADHNDAVKVEAIYSDARRISNA